MKIAKIFGIILIFATVLAFAACDNDNSPSDVNASENNDQDQSNNASHKITYVYSVTSKVIHKSDCHHANRINDEYKRELKGDPMDYLDDGYSLCKTCFPPAKDDTEPPANEVDDPNAIKKEDATFVINIKTHKFHKLDCYHAESMSQSNREYTILTIEELLELEFIPCGTCLPDEAEQWKELHGEEK